MQKRISPFLLLGMLCSCASQGSDAKIIATSFYPVYFVVSQIVGDHYQIQNLTPFGSEPHDYQLTPKTRAVLEDAELLFINGLGMETWAISLDQKLSAKTRVLSDGLEALSIEGRVDPHVWLCLDNYLEMGEKVVTALTQIDKAHASVYETNYQSFSERILSLKSECETIAETFENKAIAVSHAAYGYLCRDFGIEQLYINGLSPDDQPQAQSLGKIIDAMNEKGIDTVFFEELVSPEIAQYIASQTGAKTETLNPLENLTQKEADEQKDFFSIYLENMRKIAKAKP